MKLDTMAVLKQYDTLAEAEMAKSILDGARIWSMINNEYMSTIYPTGVMPAQVIVMHNDLDRAKRLIDEVIPELEPVEEEV